MTDKNTDFTNNEKMSDLGRLIRQVRLTYYQINQIFMISGLDVKGNSSAYGILSDIYFRGPKSIPELLEERAISRQSIHRMIQTLKADGILEYVDNPEHKRSKKIALTDKGTLYFEDKLKTVRESMIPIAEALDHDQIKSAYETMLTVRDGFNEFIDSVETNLD